MNFFSLFDEVNFTENGSLLDKKDIDQITFTLVPFASTTDNQTTEALERKSDKGPDNTAKEDVIDAVEGEATAEPDDFEDPVVVTVDAEIVAIRQLKKMTLNTTWSHSEVTNLLRRGSVLVLTTPCLSTVTGMYWASFRASSFWGQDQQIVSLCTVRSEIP